jgi:aryl-alcohol dehydrogenase-like predicted oxidoreductase
VYSNGCSEEIIGEAIKRLNIPREDLVIMTKIFYHLDPVNQPPISQLMNKTAQSMVNRVGLSRKHIINAVDTSIARLGTYIVVLQIHCLDRECSQEEIMHALNDVVASGKVRYLGASSMSTWEFQKLQYIADKNGWHKFISCRIIGICFIERKSERWCRFARILELGLSLGVPWLEVRLRDRTRREVACGMRMINFYRIW